MVYKSFDKNTTSLGDKSTAGRTVKNEIISTKELAEELHKPIIRKFEKSKSTITFYRQYLGRRSNRYAIDK